MSAQTITLTKERPSISLTKKSESGNIGINLNWTSKKAKGFFGGIFSSALDLDLGCLFELEDGTKGCVQALGNAFGAINSAPYIQLDADDRSGNAQNGENMGVNLKHWGKIKRVLIYAFIYEGAKNWSEADGVVRLQVPGNGDIVVNLDSAQDGNSMCAIAVLDNNNGSIEVTRQERYFKGHRQMDESFNWGLNWTAGQK